MEKKIKNKYRFIFDDATIVDIDANNQNAAAIMAIASQLTHKFSPKLVAIFAFNEKTQKWVCKNRRGFHYTIDLFSIRN